MELTKIGIATAQINGLAESPYYFDEKCYFAWDIMFTEPSTIFLNNITFINVGRDEEQAEALCNQIKENFKEALISDGDKVALIISSRSGNVRAISSTGRDSWIDVKDEFKVKTFNELDLNIDSLIVF